MLKDLTEKNPPLNAARNDFFVDESLDALLHEADAAPAVAADYFFIIENKRFIKIRFADIVSIQASRCYIIINSIDGNRHYVIISMLQLEKRLPTHAFCRIHRSWIIPVDGISEIATQRIMVHGKWFPLSSTFRKRLISYLSPYIFNRRFPNEPG